MRSMVSSSQAVIWLVLFPAMSYGLCYQRHAPLALPTIVKVSYSFDCTIDAPVVCPTTIVQMHTPQAAASKRQIFSPKEAFAMLSREVLDVFRQQDPTMYVDTHGDDVYTWNVWIGGFRADSPLARVSRGLSCCRVVSMGKRMMVSMQPKQADLLCLASCCIEHPSQPAMADPSCTMMLQDMLEVSRRFSQSTVHLRFSFKRGLHPFYPPAVEIIRPHLQAPMPGAVASHPMLKLQNWDPWRRNVDVFKVLKEFLEVGASAASACTVRLSVTVMLSLYVAGWSWQASCMNACYTFAAGLCTQYNRSRYGTTAG